MHDKTALPREGLFASAVVIPLRRVAAPAVVPVQPGAPVTSWAPRKPWWRRLIERAIP
ncbi:MAG: hypothetical protein HY778_02015 [Betaproteobacteria bacterium]|nr:hypothetical protein [Betaproteobacteria bacterium]